MVFPFYVGGGGYCGSWHLVKDVLQHLADPNVISLEPGSVRPFVFQESVGGVQEREDGTRRERFAYLLGERSHYFGVVIEVREGPPEEGSSGRRRSVSMVFVDTVDPGHSISLLQSQKLISTEEGPLPFGGCRIQGAPAETDCSLAVPKRTKKRTNVGGSTYSAEL